jgi:poly-gamma-glutamate capsule biosynthesis protein CapA/YwtB (metallophosphatase superfamily)
MASAHAVGDATKDNGTLKLFLCGDVMTGRGIDQVLPHPVKPVLHEPYVRSAQQYVDLAERASGPISRPADFRYIWGDALAVLERLRPDARIVNLETSVTSSDDHWPGKGVHYRMHPMNVGCLTAAGIDCCVLANNHVMDWGRFGLLETLATLNAAGMRTADAGRDAGEAAAPALIDVAGRARVLVFAGGMPGSGIPGGWAATGVRAGVNLLETPSPRNVDAIARRVRAVKRGGDIAVFSIHWGGNWGYEITVAERDFAHRLVDIAGIDVVHGHSSHHVKGIEVYRDKPILYGCGDFIDDYEGIGGQEPYRAELGLMYFPAFDLANGKLSQLELAPTRIRRFCLNRADAGEVAWLMHTIDREGRKLGTRVERRPDETLALHGSGI